MSATKDVQINKFRVKCDGVYYGPGQSAGNILYDLPEEMADALIADSNGTIVEIPKRETNQNNVKNVKKKSAPEEEIGLPAVDPKGTVKR